LSLFVEIADAVLDDATTPVAALFSVSSAPGALPRSVTLAAMGREVGTLVASTFPGSALSDAISVALEVFVDTVFGTGRAVVDFTTVAAVGAGTGAFGRPSAALPATEIPAPGSFPP
jgi:hypothetical protein